MWNQLGKTIGNVWQGFSQPLKNTSNFIGKNYTPVLKKIHKGAKMVNSINQKARDFGLDLVPGLSTASNYIHKGSKFITNASSELLKRQKDVDKFNNQIQRLPDKLPDNGDAIYKMVRDNLPKNLPKLPKNINSSNANEYLKKQITKQLLNLW